MYGVYINSIGKFLPGNPISNDQMEAYLGKINGRASKVRQRILKSNGIQQRYYALDQLQTQTYRNSEMAARAIRDALAGIDLEPGAIDLLAAGTTWADLLVPGFASMVHGELPEFSPLETVSAQGVCCAGISALKYATAQVQLGEKLAAIAVASEMPSRLFKHTNFEAETTIQAEKSLPFDTEFLRWMLSDGAGALLIQNHPKTQGLSLKIEWIELISHANAYPVCMYAGAEDETAQKSWMHYPSYVAAAQSGVINLRQNIRLLDHVIKLGVEGWLRLIDLGRVQPSEIDWLLCHYSSHFFRGQIVELLDKAGCLIPEEKWFTNLYTRGNTGCASIYLMLEELFHSNKLQPGQKIFCFIPESGRFTTAYMMLTVIGQEGRQQGTENREQEGNREQEQLPLKLESWSPTLGPPPSVPEIPASELNPSPLQRNATRTELDTPPLQRNATRMELDTPPSVPEIPASELNTPPLELDTPPLELGASPLQRNASPSELGASPSELEIPASVRVASASQRVALSTILDTPPSALRPPSSELASPLLRQLAIVWLEFERQLRSVPIIRKLNRGEFTLEDYQALLRNLRPQVVEGSRWIARAASNMIDFRLRSTFIGHAQEEHRDYQMLERNYVSVGGVLEDIVQAEKNLGSEALSAFIFHQASRENPVDLIGSMFIIEGLGNHLAGKWAAQIQQTLNLRDEQVSFLAYHGANDESHIGKLHTLMNADWMTPDIAQRIVKTAQVTARLYLMQLEEIQ